MIEYKPYESKDITTHYFLIKEDFVWVSIDNARLKDLSNGVDYDELTYGIELSKDSIIAINYFLHKDSQSEYCYLSFYHEDDEIFDIYQESIISRKFLISNDSIFEDITIKYIRDKKIEKLID